MQQPSSGASATRIATPFPNWFTSAGVPLTATNRTAKPWQIVARITSRFALECRGSFAPRVIACQIEPGPPVSGRVSGEGLS